ncbi:MAG: SDR family oxidoreductase [Planctomycetia bacterium]|nr:SDR family oxidoreductase [Planctomycetia bacterium]
MTQGNEPTVRELFDLTGRVAMVTGSTGYLGRSMAAALAEAGARVIVTCIDGELARRTAEALPDPHGVGHKSVVLDHMDNAGPARSFAEAVELAGKIDILVNNGHEPLGRDWTDVTGEQFSRQLANATGYFLLARELRDHVVARKAPASVIMLGSMYGHVASYPECYEGVCPANSVAYQVLKGGVIQMTRHLAVYWARDGIRVNSISPGPFPPAAAPQEMTARLCKKSPMGRIGKPHELRGAVLFLASDASSYVTGHDLKVDGGWTAW